MPLTKRYDHHYHQLLSTHLRDAETEAETRVALGAEEIVSSFFVRAGDILLDTVEAS